MNGVTNGHSNSDDDNEVDAWVDERHQNDIENWVDEAVENYHDDEEEEDVDDVAEEDAEPEPGTEAALEYGTFNPPLYRQRYSYALQILKSSNWIQAMSRIVDIGCAECKFLQMLKTLPRAREAIGLDIDLDLLEYHKRRLEPLFIDYLEPRTETPLNMHLVQGSIAECDNRLEDVDAVTAIELIEHLTPDILEKFPQTVFGQMKPKIVIITTPNKEYNVLFEHFEGPFRHWDHKFEWTRSEFQNWVETCILDKYPDYVVERFDGVGEGPENIGECSQLVVLIRKEFKISSQNGEYDNISLDEDDALAIDRKSLVETDNFANEDENLLKPYKIVATHHYPMRRETRSRDKIIFDEANYKLYALAEASPAWEDEERALIDLKLLLDCEKISGQDATVQELCDILESNGFEVEAIPNNDSFGAYVPYPEKSDSNFSDDENNYENDVITETEAFPVDEDEEDWD